jgi:hypothetical protein
MNRLISTFAIGSAGFLALRRIRRVAHELDSKRNPEFYYRPVPPIGLGVPVFTYHSVAGPGVPDSVTPIDFDRQMRHLVRNGYHTLTADEFYGYLTGTCTVPTKSIVIAFDDGRASLWTVAFPILKHYGLKAVCFLIPSLMATHGLRPALGLGKPTNLCDVDLTDAPAITWDEARIMHASGLVDFQSHTLDHRLVFTGPQIVDFCQPRFNFGYANLNVPVLRQGETDLRPGRPPWGTPFYRCQSRLGAARRYYDDQSLRSACAHYVAERGGAEFFARRAWRDELMQVAAAYRQSQALVETFEDESGQAAAIRSTLVESKRWIEDELPGRTVRHLCPPWHRSSALAIGLARSAGYVAAFIDVNPQKLSPNPNNPYAVQRRLPANEYGDDPFQITRVDARENMVLSLPGAGRLSYRQRLITRLLEPKRDR